MQKNGYVYKMMAFYRRKFLLVMVIISLIFGWFTMAKIPYLRTSVKGASPLDTSRFVEECETMIIKGKVELGRKDKKTPEVNVFRSNSYWQDGRYLFNIKLDSVGDEIAVYTKEIAIGNETETFVASKVYTAYLAGVPVTVIAKGNWDKSLNVTGHLIKVHKPVLSALTKNMKNGETIETGEYTVDLRGLEMDAEKTDVFLFWLFLAIILTIWLKLILYYIKPTRTPTYKQLIRFDDMETAENDINLQYGDCYTEGKNIVLKDYIIEKSTFKIKISRNHMAKN